MILESFCRIGDTMRLTAEQVKSIEDSTQYVSQIDFDYSPFQHDTVIVGTKGNGKTRRSKKICLTIPNLAVWIWQYSIKTYDGFFPKVTKVEDLKYGQYVLDSPDKSKENLGRFLYKAFQQKNLLIIIDELHQYTNKNEIWMPLYQYVMSGRNRHLTGIYISTSPKAIPNYILGNARHVFAYQMNSALDLDWLHDYIGPEAWLLVTKDRRSQFYMGAEHIGSLPEYSFVYRDNKKERPQVVMKK